VKRFWRLVGTVVLAVVVVAPAAALATMLVIAPAQVKELERPPSPLVIGISEIAVDGAVNAKLTLELGPRPRVLANGATGRVTGVQVAAGDVLESGEVAYSIDGIDRLAFCSDEPFYRQLRSGDRGRDVVALKSLLVAEGINLDSDGDRYDWATGQAVKQLRTQLGDPRSSTTFEPELVVWLPAVSFEIGEVDLEIGVPAPPLGSPVLLGTFPLLAATVTANGDATLSPSLVGGPVLDSATGSQLGTLTSVDGVTNLSERYAGDLVAGGTAQGESGATRNDEQRVEIDVVVRFAKAEVRYVVPASAVVTDPSGSVTCVWLESNGGWVAQRVEIEAVDQPGTVGIIEWAQAISDKVLANPGEYLEQPTCPST